MESKRLSVRWDLKYARKNNTEDGVFNSDDTSLLEVVVPQGARIDGRSAHSLRLMYRHGVTLLGVSRQGKQFIKRVQDLEIQAGDILLLLGNNEKLDDIANWLGCLPLAERGLQVTQRKKAGLAVGIFASAVITGQFRRALSAGCSRHSGDTDGADRHHAASAAV